MQITLKEYLRKKKPTKRLAKKQVKFTLTIYKPVSRETVNKIDKFLLN